MSRRKVGPKRKRGRPRLLHAKRRARTREGRKTGIDPVELDRGTRELRARKRRATGGREDLPLDVAGILYGRDHLDRLQFDLLGQIAEWLRLIAGMGQGDVSVQGLWQSILAAGSTRSGFGAVPTADDGASVADLARRRLGRALRQLNGSTDLVLSIASNEPTPLIERVVAGMLTLEDRVQLEVLRNGLDGLMTGGRRRAAAE